MKRSTLTLSILTALLVSACGGSSSNDEQTKDPTPPKVTPTNPTTPSTGRTPTTGKKEPKKEEENASSSSSDSTPPISSGSAPSGGKPIVITGEPKKEDEDKGKGKTDDNKGDGKTDEDKNKDKDKTDEGKKEQEEGQSPEVSAAKEQLTQSEATLDQAKKNAATQTAAAKHEVGKLTTLKEKINTANSNFNKTTDQIEKVLILADSEQDKKKAQDLRNFYNDYVKQQSIADAEQKKADQAKMDEEKAAAQVQADAKALALSEAKAKWDSMPQVQSVKEAAEAEQKHIEAQHASAAATAKAGALGTKESSLTTLQGTLTAKKGALENLLNTATTEDTKEKIKAAIKKVGDELEQIKEDLAKVTADKTRAEAEKGIQEGNATTAKGDFETKEALTKNLGVAGGKDLTDGVFLGVQKAKEASGAWTITFDGIEKEIKVTDANGDIGPNNTEYGKSGDLEGKKSAHKALTNSVYGYFDNKFYSVGVVTTPAEMEQIPAAKVGRFSGKSLLKDAEGNNIVSEVVGSINTFQGDNKKFTGNFNTFKKVDGATLKEIKEGTLSEPVHFTATIDKNTFKPAENLNPGEASVYGYFYGSGVTEAGGLVELKNVFHGSFGGEIEK